MRYLIALAFLALTLTGSVAIVTSLTTEPVLARECPGLAAAGCPQ
ncbi:hypothetical protein [Bradyrhizobium sp. CCGUVB23]|nr:hypothetical protein [Bradyrhizobium sp. CCGUVB23]